MTGPIDPANDYWKIKVADGECQDDSYVVSDNDEWDVIFRSVSGGTADLDDYLPIDGSKAMTGPLQADTKVTAKVKDDGNTFETAVLMADYGVLATVQRPQGRCPTSTTRTPTQPSTITAQRRPLTTFSLIGPSLSSSCLVTTAKALSSGPRRQRLRCRQ